MSPKAAQTFCPLPCFTHLFSDSPERRELLCHPCPTDPSCTCPGHSLCPRDGHRGEGCDEYPSPSRRYSAVTPALLHPQAHTHTCGPAHQSGLECPGRDREPVGPAPSIHRDGSPNTAQLRQHCPGTFGKGPAGTAAARSLLQGCV